MVMPTAMYVDRTVHRDWRAHLQVRVGLVRVVIQAEHQEGQGPSLDHLVDRRVALEREQLPQSPSGFGSLRGIGALQRLRKVRHMRWNRGWALAALRSRRFGFSRQKRAALGDALLPLLLAEAHGGVSASAPEVRRRDAGLDVATPLCYGRHGLTRGV